MNETHLKPRTLHWFALLLLTASVCINYADRGNLAIAAVRLQSELHLTGRNRLCKRVLAVPHSPLIAWHE